MHIGLFNPGAMGAAVGACLTRAGHQVYWLSPGRSKQTVQRAARAGLTPCQTLGQLTGCVELAGPRLPDEPKAGAGESEQDGGGADACGAGDHAG